MQIDNINFCLVLDVWEGNLDIDEQELWDGGVRGIYVRLNDMNGGHHLDENFVIQWAQSKRFVRAPYFVYNPWVSGTVNFAWLKANMPADAHCVVIDNEVRYPGYSPTTYAGEFEIFRTLCAKQWKVVIYTGGGYVSLMSKWPMADYIWARYPGDYYPTDAALIRITWDQLREKLAKTEWNPGCTLSGTCKMWQISDRYIFHGGTTRLDLNVFRGSYEDLKEFFDSDPGIVDDPTDEETETVEQLAINYTALKSGQIVRDAPGTTGTNKIGTLTKGQVLTGLQDVRILSYNSVWGKFASVGGWVAFVHGGTVYLK